MEEPQPDQIHLFPQNGECKYLFKTTLAEFDTVSDLILVGGTTEYIQGLPESIRNKITDDDGLHVMLYAQKFNRYVTIKPGLQQHTPGCYRLCKNFWVRVAEYNGFRAGDVIECWGLYVPPQKKGEEATLSLLMQKVVEKKTEQQGGAEPSSSK